MVWFRQTRPLPTASIELRAKPELKVKANTLIALEKSLTELSKKIHVHTQTFVIKSTRSRYFNEKVYSHTATSCKYF